jgi:hypothetical protein
MGNNPYVLCAGTHEAFALAVQYRELVPADTILEAGGRSVRTVRTLARENWLLAQKAKRSVLPLIMRSNVLLIL